MALSNPTQKLSNSKTHTGNPVTQADPSAPLSPGEVVATLLTGGAVAGDLQAIQAAMGSQIEPHYFGAETMRAVIAVAVQMAETWGAVGECGTTQEAWDMVMEGYLKDIPDGRECAAYCRGYWQDWRAGEDEAATAKYSAPNTGTQHGD